VSYETLLTSCAQGVARIVVLVGLSEEGVAAFFEKRAPQWTGR
jgi:hypothetical protein